jgi:hypothetical protein
MKPRKGGRGGGAPGTVTQSKAISRMVRHALQELLGTPDNSHGEQRKGKVSHGKGERLGTELMKMSGSAVHKEGTPSWCF